jgi:fructan beta-fructosidase
MVYSDGEYHLYYQHNPYGWDWGNMHWGHAVSLDLVHWTELGDALTPRSYGDWCFSGSAVVDRENSSGFGRNGKAPLVLAYTSTGRGECIAYSKDRGRSWTEFAGNPVVKHRGRDPRLLWHGPSRRWVMAVYDEENDGRAIAIYTSPDLKQWTYRSRIDGFFECPDLFELPVRGRPGETRWVLSAADGEYVLGRFDGERFAKKSGKHRVWYGDAYAAQTFSDAPDGRRIQIGWARGVTFPREAFNQQMTVPCELTLRPTSEGLRMFVEPVSEVLRPLGPAAPLDAGASSVPVPAGEFLADLTAEIKARGKLTASVHGTPIVYDAAARVLTCGGVAAPLAPDDGAIRLLILADRGSLEVFANGGRVAISKALAWKRGSTPLALEVEPEAGRWRSAAVAAPASAWDAPR